MIGVITYINNKNGLILGMDHEQYVFSVFDIVTPCPLKVGIIVKFRPCFTNLIEVKKATYIEKLTEK